MKPDDANVPYVAIPVKDNFLYTQALVTSLIEQGEISPAQIHIYDNGSVDETKAEMESLGVTVIDAFGWSFHRMWNHALASGNGLPVGILNNDIAIGPNFISSMAAALETDKSLAVVCPNYDDRSGEMNYVANIQAGRMDGTGGIAGWAYMIAGDWAQDFRFPEELNWWYGDNVLIDSIVMAGRKCGITGATTVVHLDGGSRTGNWTADMVEPDRIWYGQWRNGFRA